MSFQFSVKHHGKDKLGLTAILERYANEQWVGNHYSQEQAIESVTDRFRRAVEAELQLLEVAVKKTQ